MAQVFASQFGRQVAVVLTSLATFACLAGVAVAYYWTPAYWRVGYQPVQPIEYSHKIHVGQLALDCRYCHTYADQSGHANVPTVQVCMNCHGQQWGNIKANSSKLAPLREAWDTGKPVPWVRIHKLADYAYFNHSVHIARGVACVSCHGRIDEMARSVARRAVKHVVVSGLPSQSRTAPAIEQRGDEHAMERGARLRSLAAKDPR